MSRRNFLVCWCALGLAAALSTNVVAADDSPIPAEDGATDVDTGAGGAATTDTESPAADSEAGGDAAPAQASQADVEAAALAGHNAWMLTSTALVLFMTAPGLAMFYGGLVRKKNVLGVIMQCLFLMGLMTVVWALWGYSFAFGGDSPFFGNGQFLFMNEVSRTWSVEGAEPYTDENGNGEHDEGEPFTDVNENDQYDAMGPYTPPEGGIPRLTHMLFQGMFFIITPALICGAFAERMKFSSMVVFSVLWGLLVYCPVCHWVWADGGWFASGSQFHALDFAGGTVVHISSGASALVCALILGKRLGFGQEPMPPHNLTYTCIGTGLLWVGWFGFNAGSAGGADHMAVNAFVATHLAAAAGVVAWSAAEWVFNGKPSILGGCSGAVAGLVCITPAAGAVTPLSGIILGLIAGFVCYLACTKLKNTFNYDDSLDAFGVHGVGGTLGAILTGVFTNETLAGTKGLLGGNAQQLINQLVSVVATIVLAVVVSFILLKVIDSVMGLRVSQDDELKGLDVTQHGEEGYIFL